MLIQPARPELVGNVRLLRSAKPPEAHGLHRDPEQDPGARWISALHFVGLAGAAAGRHDPPPTPECLSTPEVLSIMKNVSDIKKIICIHNS